MKFYGKIGFIKTEETAPDKYEEKTIEKDAIGDVTNAVGRWNKSDGINDDVELQLEFSILMDPYVEKNYPYIRYIVHNGVKWKVKSVMPKYPRIVLATGGVYNG